MSNRFLALTVVLLAIAVIAKELEEKKPEWIQAELVDDYDQRFSAPQYTLMETSAHFRPSAKLYRMSQQQRQQEYMHGYDHGFEHARFAQEYPRFTETQAQTQTEGITDPVLTNGQIPAGSEYYTRYGIYNNNQPPYYSPFSPYYSYPPAPPPMPTYLPPPPYIPPSPQPMSTLPAAVAATTT